MKKVLGHQGGQRIPIHRPPMTFVYLRHHVLMHVYEDNQFAVLLAPLIPSPALLLSSEAGNPNISDAQVQLKQCHELPPHKTLTVG